MKECRAEWLLAFSFSRFKPFPPFFLSRADNGAMSSSFLDAFQSPDIAFCPACGALLPVIPAKGDIRDGRRRNPVSFVEL